MRRIALYLAGVGLLLVSVPAAARTIRTVGFELRAHAILERYTNAGRFSGVVLVAAGGETIFRRAYGYADVSTQAPATVSTRFAIGSLTKQFTAVSILRLGEIKKLSLKDSLETYFPDFGATGITLHHLLTHTSGIPDYFELDDIDAIFSKPDALDVLVDRLVPLGHHFTAGARYEYSNSNYALLGGIVEKISGESYGAFLERQLGKAWMTETGVFRPTAPPPGMAAGHRRGSSGKMLTLPTSELEDLSRIPGDGALFSTVDDLLLWTRALQAGRLLGPEASRTRVTPLKNGYACGIVVGTKAGRPALYHGGSVEGFRSFLASFPQDDVVLALLSNLDATREEAIADELLDALFATKLEWSVKRFESPDQS